MKTLSICSIALMLMATLAGCGGSHEHKHKTSYAIYAEYAKGSNKLMQSGINRRVYDTVEVQAGDDITLEKDGSITLKPGTYHFTGFSTVTMQASMTIPVTTHNYPGYCLLYPSQYENDSALALQNRLGVGSPTDALDVAPSVFDAIRTFTQEENICVGHQCGKIFPTDRVYMSVYDVDGTLSPYHVFSRITITKE